MTIYVSMSKWARASGAQPNTEENSKITLECAFCNTFLLLRLRLLPLFICLVVCLSIIVSHLLSLSLSLCLCPWLRTLLLFYSLRRCVCSLFFSFDVHKIYINFFITVRFCLCALLYTIIMNLHAILSLPHCRSNSVCERQTFFVLLRLYSCIGIRNVYYIYGLCVRVAFYFLSRFLHWPRQIISILRCLSLRHFSPRTTFIPFIWMYSIFAFCIKFFSVSFYCHVFDNDYVDEI